MELRFHSDALMMQSHLVEEEKMSFLSICRNLKLLGHICKANKVSIYRFGSPL